MKRFDSKQRELVGGRFRTIREASGLSQSNLAKRCGVTQVTIWRLESGKRGASVELLSLAADVFGISPSAFLNGGNIGGAVRLVEASRDLGKFEVQPVTETEQPPWE